MVMSSILGPDGQPIDRSILSEPQTARHSQLQREFQGHPSRGLTPSRLAQILEAAEQGDLIAQFELFDDMEEKDAHIASEMGKRRRAVTQLDWQLVPPPNPSAKEKKATAQLQELLKEIPNFEDALYDTTDAIGKGFECGEIEWNRVERMWLPKSIEHRPQTWFRLFRGYRQEVRLRGLTSEGEPLQTFGWIKHTHKAKSGYLERASLFRTLVWPYLFKNYSIADLAEWLEIYGIPLRLGKFPAGASEKEKTALLRALVSIGHNAAGIIPDGAAIDFHETATGDAKAFELMIDWCERSESKVILGATLTSQAGRGSNTNALGNVHNEVRKDLRDADVKQFAPTITRDLVYPIGALNGLVTDGIRRCPRFVLNTSEPEDIKTYSDALPNLVKLGMKIKRKDAQEKLGFSEPEDDEEILTMTPEPAAPIIDPTKPLTPIAKATAQRATAPKPDYIDALVDSLAASTGQMTDGWIETIRAIVESSSSYDELLGRMSELVTTLPLNDLAQQLESAITVAGLAGRYDVQTETETASNA